MLYMKGISNLLILVGTCSAWPHQQPSQCPANQDCVLLNQCSSGNIITDGSGIFGPRGSGGTKLCTLPSIPGADAICCKKPGHPLPKIPRPPLPHCPKSKVCVSQRQCDRNGNVVTDGRGIIGPRGNIQECNVGNTSEVGVCCTPPIVYPIPTKCGVRQDTIPSNEAQFGEFPWQAIIFRNGIFQCGASLVSKDTLVTAAHCVYNVNHRDLKVRVGEWKLNSYEEPIPHNEIDVSNVITHNLFNIANHHNNIAVVKLVKSLDFQFHINRICLPRPGQTFPGMRCIATGWGKDAVNGQKRDVLKKIEVPIVKHDKCQSDLRKTILGRYFQLDDSFMCAGGEENKDTCQGDGGGPLACEDLGSGQYFLAGITSYGIECGKKDVPGVYTDVLDFRTFVDDLTD